MTARRLSQTLSGAIVLLVLAMGAGFYYFSQWLSEAALTANHARADTQLADSSVTQLQQLQSALETQQPAVIRAAQVVAQSREYQYQDQIVQDINTYATRAGVKILGYDFGAAPTVGTSTSATATSPAQAQALAQLNAAGVKVITANITLATPVNYDAYLRFLRAIEQNLTKMQVTGITMSPDVDTTKISSPSIGLQIYVRAN